MRSASVPDDCRGVPSALVIGLGTIINVVAIVIGSLLGVLLGNRLPERTRVAVTDALGLVTLVIAATNVVALFDGDFTAAVGTAAPLLIVLFSLLIGGIIGSLLRLESRMESVGGWLQRRLGGSGDSGSKARFIEGFVDASLIFCIGPLAILGAMSDGLGKGIEQLALKSVLDLFAAMAFAATMGWGVMASAISVGVYQGVVTVLAALVGPFLGAALIASITATGGVLLMGVGLRLLHIRQVPVGDLLPALIVAPVLTAIVSAFIGV